MTVESEPFLPISGLQHLLFCERQCALIHVDREWRDNVLTADGQVVHRRVDEFPDEHRGDSRIVRRLPLRSERLRMQGVADAVEITMRDGRPVEAVPVEYKRSRKRLRVVGPDPNAVQLCAQAMALEEMLGIDVPVGCLFFHASRRRVEVELDSHLRHATEGAARRFHELLDTGALPPAANDARCRRCSLIEICRPAETARKTDLTRYVARLFDRALP